MHGESGGGGWGIKTKGRDGKISIALDSYVHCSHLCRVVCVHTPMASASNSTICECGGVKQV